MINTEKVIGFYTDAFGREVNVYEQKCNYTLSYFGYLFVGDSDEWNSHDMDDWSNAYSIYNAYKYDTEIELKDNRWDTVLKYDTKTDTDDWY